MRLVSEATANVARKVSCATPNGSFASRTPSTPAQSTAQNAGPAAGITLGGLDREQADSRCWADQLVSALATGRRADEAGSGQIAHDLRQKRIGMRTEAAITGVLWRPPSRARASSARIA